MPLGSHVEMNETTAYINSDVFMKFLKNHFILRKEPGKVLLILDSHASLCSDMGVLDLAAENDVILFYLPSHITQYLQSFGRSFFKLLKTYWRQALSSLIHNKSNRKVSRLQFGSLLNAAWSKVATVGNATSGFILLLGFTLIARNQSHSMHLLLLIVPAMVQL
ncbi:jerky protein homolog-like [Trichonephila clavata]|uniref:Jerky protein homolog-like n=1 Tax=Trichonephila clavata TaxID=2740835 RepID=A0A8X6JUU1_TRICU|nr:jerky protein homolog-like [Trichonephila clavata]